MWRECVCVCARVSACGCLRKKSYDMIGYACLDTWLGVGHLACIRSPSCCPAWKAHGNAPTRPHAHSFAPEPAGAPTSFRVTAINSSADDPALTLDAATDLRQGPVSRKWMVRALTAAAACGRLEGVCAIPVIISGVSWNTCCPK